MKALSDPAPTGTVTLREFEALPERDEYRIEVSRGRLVHEPRPGAAHGLLTGRMVRLLGTYAEREELGAVVTETGFLLNREPPTVRGPDVAFIPRDRIEATEGISEAFWQIAPALAVEVLSPSNSAAEIQAKVLEYLEAGTALVWVIDPGSRAVTVWRAPGQARLLSGNESLDGEDVLPGFTLALDELFAGLG